MARVHLFADASMQPGVTDQSCPMNNRIVSGTGTSTDSGISYNDRLNPLHIACSGGHYHTVDYLIQKGADINACDDNGKSSLYMTCKYGHANIVELLLSKGANVNICDEDGVSPLYIACQQGDNDIVKLLIRYGAVVDNKNNKSQI